MHIRDWFDVKNKEHIKAWRHLERHGSWPKDFVPSDLELGPLWHIDVMSKLASQYVHEYLEKERINADS